MLFAALLGWLEREQPDAIASLREENRTLKAQLSGRRLRLRSGTGMSGPGLRLMLTANWSRHGA
jgi:hypothetical protein